MSTSLVRRRLGLITTSVRPAAPVAVAKAPAPAIAAIRAPAPAPTPVAVAKPPVAAPAPVVVKTTQPVMVRPVATPAPAPVPASTVIKPAVTPPAGAFPSPYSFAQLAAGTVPWDSFVMKSFFETNVVLSNTDDYADDSQGDTVPAFITVIAPGPAGGKMLAALESGSMTIDPETANYLISDPTSNNTRLYNIANLNGYAHLYGPFPVKQDSSWGEFLTVIAIAGVFVGASLVSAGEFADVPVALDGTTAPAALDAPAASTASSASSASTASSAANITNITNITSTLPAQTIGAVDTPVVSLDGVVSTPAIDASAASTTAATQSLESVTIHGAAIAGAGGGGVAAATGAAAVAATAAAATHGLLPGEGVSTLDGSGDDISSQQSSGGAQGGGAPPAVPPPLDGGTGVNPLDALKAGTAAAGTAGSVAKLIDGSSAAPTAGSTAGQPGGSQTVTQGVPYYASSSSAGSDGLSNLSSSQITSAVAIIGGGLLLMYFINGLGSSPSSKSAPRRREPAMRKPAAKPAQPKAASSTPGRTRYVLNAAAAQKYQASKGTP